MGRPALVCGPMIHRQRTKVQNSSAIRACGGPGDGHFSLYLFTRDEKCKFFHARIALARLTRENECCCRGKKANMAAGFSF